MKTKQKFQMGLLEGLIGISSLQSTLPIWNELPPSFFSILDFCQVNVLRSIWGVFFTLLKISWAPTEELAIWRGVTPMRSDQSVHPSSTSSADLAAKEWSYRFLGVSYEVFDTLLAEADSFDEKHFSNPFIYQEWNRKIILIPTYPTPQHQHRAFVLIGGICTLQQTQHSILHNLVYQICSPPACVAHVILHFLQADNCPHVKGDDPYGEVVVPLK